MAGRPDLYPFMGYSPEYWEEQLKARDTMDEEWIKRQIQEKGQAWVDRERQKGTLNVPSMEQNAFTVRGDYTVTPEDRRQSRDYYIRLAMSEPTEEETLFTQTQKPFTELYPNWKYPVREFTLEQSSPDMPVQSAPQESPTPGWTLDEPRFKPTPQQGPDAEDILRQLYERMVSLYSLLPDKPKPITNTRNWGNLPEFGRRRRY